METSMAQAQLPEGSRGPARNRVTTAYAAVGAPDQPGLPSGQGAATVQLRGGLSPISSQISRLRAI
jgi:hypothetical protein